jgi:hypothetical protein
MRETVRRLLYLALNLRIIRALLIWPCTWFATALASIGVDLHQIGTLEVLQIS